MPKEEAIRILDPETSRDALWTYEGDEERLEAVNEACRVACAALRAQQHPAKLDRSRWEGCEWCKSMEKNVEDFECGEVCAISGAEYTFWGDGAEYIKPERFCPMCGRPLTDEAWSELERRINGGTVDL